MPDEPVKPGEYTGQGDDPTAGHSSVEHQDAQYPQGEADDEAMGPAPADEADA